MLYARSELLQTMAPWEGRVDDRHRQPDGGHHGIRRRGAEAGTPNTGIIGLGAALTYVSQLGLTQVPSMSDADALRARCPARGTGSDPLRPGAA